MTDLLRKGTLLWLNIAWQCGTTQFADLSLASQCIYFALLICKAIPKVEINGFRLQKIKM